MGLLIGSALIGGILGFTLTVTQSEILTGIIFFIIVVLFTPVFLRRRPSNSGEFGFVLLILSLFGPATIAMWMVQIFE